MWGRSGRWLLISQTAYKRCKQQLWSLFGKVNHEWVLHQTSPNSDVSLDTNCGKYKIFPSLQYVSVGHLVLHWQQLPSIDTTHFEDCAGCPKTAGFKRNSKHWWLKDKWSHLDVLLYESLYWRQYCLLRNIPEQRLTAGYLVYTKMQYKYIAGWWCNNHLEKIWVRYIMGRKFPSQIW